MELKTIRIQRVVEKQNLASVMKSGSLDVLATPQMIAWMEEAACLCLELEEGEYVVEKAPMTLPQLSVRLGIIIYGELILFPILIQIFSNLFASLDMQKVFATKDIFMLCIFVSVFDFFIIYILCLFSYPIIIFIVQFDCVIKINLTPTIVS